MKIDKDRLFIKLMNEKNVPDGVISKKIAGDIYGVVSYKADFEEDSGTKYYFATPILDVLEAIDDRENVYDFALKNMQKHYIPKMLDLSFFGYLDSHPDLYGLTAVNGDSNIHGASVILFDDFMQKFSKKHNLYGLWVIPSSIHEVLVVSDTFSKISDIEEIIREINADPNLIMPHEVLSNKLYHYSCIDHAFELAEEYEDRIALPFC